MKKKILITFVTLFFGAATAANSVPNYPVDPCEAFGCTCPVWKCGGVA